MKFVKVIGLLSELDAFLGSCCVDGTFQPEQAMQYMSDSMGYTQLVEENPYAPMLQKIEELASSSGIHLREVEKIPKPVTNEETEAFIRQLGSRMSELHDERKVLTDQLATCESAITQFQHFTGLDINLDDLFSCEFIKVRFGHMPKESTQKLLAYADNPYMLFIPCSSDAKEDWGVYFAPREQLKKWIAILQAFILSGCVFPEQSAPRSISLKRFRRISTCSMSRLRSWMHGLRRTGMKRPITAT